MKAMRIHAFGKPPQLDDLVAPAPVSGHTMIDVHAASVGHIDRSVMSGRFLSTPPLPYVPGVEAAGIVLSSETFEKGQRVWVRGHGLGLMRDGHLVRAHCRSRCSHRRAARRGADAAECGILFSLYIGLGGAV